MSNNKCSIIGASHAGVSLAMQLRREGWTHEIELISDDIELTTSEGREFHWQRS